MKGAQCLKMAKAEAIRSQSWDKSDPVPGFAQAHRVQELHAKRFAGVDIATLHNGFDFVGVVSARLKTRYLH